MKLHVVLNSSPVNVHLRTRWCFNLQRHNTLCHHVVLTTNRLPEATAHGDAASGGSDTKSPAGRVKIRAPSERPSGQDEAEAEDAEAAVDLEDDVALANSHAAHARRSPSSPPAVVRTHLHLR